MLRHRPVFFDGFRFSEPVDGIDHPIHACYLLWFQAVCFIHLQTNQRVFMGRRQKDRELAQKRKRKEKLKKYRKLYKMAKTEPERQSIQEKVSKISPFTLLGES